MVIYNVVVVWCLWWCDCLLACLRALTDWGSESTGKWPYLRIAFHRSPMNFWSLLPSGSNCFTRYSKSLADLNCSFRYHGAFWDLYHKIPEKELPTGMPGQWFPKTTRSQSEPTSVHFYLTMVLSRSLNVWSGESKRSANNHTFVHFSRSRVCRTAHLPRDISLTTYITKIRPVLEYASPVWGGLPIYLEEDLQRVQNRCLNVIGLPRDTVESLVTRRQNLTRKEFKRIQESEAHPCKRFLEKPVHHGHNLRSCKSNPAHLRIPVSRTVRHKQSFIPRGAKLNSIWYVYIICGVFWIFIVILP